MVDKFSPQEARKKLKLNALGLLKWLVEADNRFVWGTFGHLNTFSIKTDRGQDNKWKIKSAVIWDVIEKDLVKVAEAGEEFAQALDDIVYAKRELPVLELYRAGFMDIYDQTQRETIDGKQGRGLRFAKFISEIEDKQWNYTAKVAVLRDEDARNWWREHGASLYEKKRAEYFKEKLDYEEKTHRLALFKKPVSLSFELSEQQKAWWPKDVPVPQRRRKISAPSFVGKIVRETKLHYYVVDCVDNKGKKMSVLDQRNGQVKVEREYIMVDNVSQDVVNKIFAFQAEFEAEIKSSMSREVDEILPIVRRMDERMQQKSAEYDDRLREIIEDANCSVAAPKL